MFELPTDRMGTRALATAIVLHDRRVWGPCMVESLTANSATLLGHIDNAMASGEVMVVLALSESQLIKLKAVLHRIEVAPGDYHRCEVRFQGCDPNLEDQIQQAVLAHLERQQNPLVVALDTGPLRQARLGRDLRRLGREILVLSKPLETLWLASDRSAAFDTLIIDDSFIRIAGSWVLDFLARRWPDRRRLLACSLAAADTARVQALRPSISGILERPWTQRKLEMALGRPIMPGAGGEQRQKPYLQSFRSAAALSEQLSL
jgi:hypothetical protein